MATIRAVTEQDQIPTTKAATATIRLTAIHTNNNSHQIHTLSSLHNQPDMEQGRSRAATAKRKTQDMVRCFVWSKYVGPDKA